MTFYSEAYFVYKNDLETDVKALFRKTLVMEIL